MEIPSHFQLIRQHNSSPLPRLPGFYLPFSVGVRTDGKGVPQLLACTQATAGFLPLEMGPGLPSGRTGDHLPCHPGLLSTHSSDSSSITRPTCPEAPEALPPGKPGTIGIVAHWCSNVTFCCLSSIQPHFSLIISHVYHPSFIKQFHAPSLGMIHILLSFLIFLVLGTSSTTAWDNPLPGKWWFRA